MAKSQNKTLYSVHPGVAIMQKWVVDLPAKKGLDKRKGCAGNDGEW